MTTNKSKQGGELAGTGHWLNRTVAGAGVTSALGDFCYETTTVILHGLLAVLGVPAAVLGATVGVVWTAVSPEAAFGLAATLMLAGTIVLWRIRDN